MGRATTSRDPDDAPLGAASAEVCVALNGLRPFLDATASALSAGMLLIDGDLRVLYSKGLTSPSLNSHVEPATQTLADWLLEQADEIDATTLPALVERVQREGSVEVLELQCAGRVWQATAAPVAASDTASLLPWVIITLCDVSAKAKADELLALYVEALDEAAAGIILADATHSDMPIVHASKAFLNLTGYPLDEVLGRNSRFLQGPDTAPETILEIHAALDAGQSIDTEILNYRKDGTPFWNRLRLRPLAVVDGQPRLYLGTQEDVTETRLHLQAAHRHAHHDALTGLPNRLNLETQLARLTNQSTTNPNTLWLLFLDLDGFKAVNDSVGHASGDALLVQVAERVRNVARADDLLARLGGDEFVMLLPGGPRLEVVLRVVESTLRVLSEPFQIGTNQFHVAASIGVAVWPNDAPDGVGLLNAADQAMYLAKERGRDQAAFFDPSMDLRAKAHQGLHQAMRSTVRDLGLAIRYQPVLEVDHGVVGALAVLGWQDEWSEAFLPRSVMAVAEQSGETNNVAEWLLTAVARQRLIWGDTVPAGLRMAINVTLRQARDPAFRYLLEQLPDELLAALDVELPAAILNDLNPQPAKLLELMHKRKAQIVIQGFGSVALTPLELLHGSINIVKLEPQLLQELHAPRSAALLIAVIELGHAAGAVVQADNVTTTAERDWLAAHGCWRMQGPLFGMPMAAEAFPPFCAQMSSPSSEH